jgi:hypothetical protein
VQTNYAFLDEAQAYVAKCISSLQKFEIMCTYTINNAKKQCFHHFEALPKQSITMQE